MNEIMRDSDPVEAWIQDCLEIIPLKLGNDVSLSELFLHFKEESQDEFITIVHFSRRLRQKLGDKIVIERHQKEGEKARMVRGVVLRNDAVNRPDF